MTVPALRLVPKLTPQAVDTVALGRVANGDLSALGELYDRHARALLRFASRAAGQHEAEDVIQATFLKVAKVASTYDGRSGTARSWLYGITARLIQERHRSLARFARAVLRLGEASAHAFTATDAHRLDIDRGLRRLSDAKRMVIVLAEVEGYTCDEIALMLKVPIGTIWTRLHHARKDLRAFYEGTSS